MTRPTLTCDEFALAIDEMDGPTSATRRAALEAHLQACPSCAALLADVRSIRRSARALGPMTPPARVWARIEAAIAATEAEARVPAPRSTGDPAQHAAGWNWRAPLAAAAMFVLIVSGLSWVGGRLHQQPGRAPLAAAGMGVPAIDDFQVAAADYADAIASLEEAASAADPQMVAAVTGATLQTTLEDVDVVIGEARTALADQPGDPRSQEQLLEALGSKVALLQQTVALLDEMNTEAGVNQ